MFADVLLFRVTNATAFARDINHRTERLSERETPDCEECHMFAFGAIGIILDRLA
jgi:hypothetical protein